MLPWLEKRLDALVDAVVAHLATQWLVPLAVSLLLLVPSAAITTFALALAIVALLETQIKKTCLRKN